MSNKVSEKISELLPINELVSIKIVREDETGTPDIDMPNIRKKLAEEGLI